MRRSPSKPFYSSATLVVFSVLIALSIAVPSTAGPRERVIAVGDIHGDLDRFVGILQEVDLVDNDRRWVGGDSTLVQTGDYFDRGAQVRGVMDLLMRLQNEAAAAGGQVIVLLGNHETMNLLDIFRDVNPAAYAHFADESSVKRQAKAYKKFEKFYTALARAAGQPISLGKSTKEKWMELHPPGFLEYVEAMGPEGRYGSWLRGLPVAVELNGTLFIHGGYGPFLRGKSVEEINRRIAEELSAYDELRTLMLSDRLILPWHAIMEMKREAEREIAATASAGEPRGARMTERAHKAQKLEKVLGWDDWLLVHPDGPVWFRGAALWDEQERGGEMSSLLDGLGVQRMVAGHTVQRSAQITVRFGGRVFLIDTGMLEGVYNGQASAIEIIGDDVTAVYLGKRQVLTCTSVAVEQR